MMKPAVVALLGLVAAGAAPRGELRIKASPAVRPCVAAAAAVFQKASGIPVVVRTGDVFSVASAEGADVVVAVEEELTRVIEGGASRPDQDVEVARIPWVLATSGRQPAADVQALERSATRVLVLGGSVGREARRSLQALAPSRVRTLRDPEGPVSLEPGEAAVVPLSLAPPGEVRSLSLPPLLVRAVGVRASPRPEAARAFLDFLTSGAGASAFAACGREDAP
jgi:ABC-type molybdate transport system substrate-binding protein